MLQWSVSASCPWRRNACNRAAARKGPLGKKLTKWEHALLRTAGMVLLAIAIVKVIVTELHYH
jgi:hypothetical protein